MLLFRSLLKKAVHCFTKQSIAVKTRSYSPVKKWGKYSDADRMRIQLRLSRFTDEYHAKYREDGLMHLPLRYEIRNGTQICVEERSFPGNTLPAASVHNMEPHQIDIIFKSLLIQLRQLEDIQFVHGAISPATVEIRPNPRVFSASVTDITAGRFLDEPVLDENLVFTDCMTPETCRALKYPYADQIQQETDVFSAACLYYYFLTGHLLEVGDSPVTPAEAVWLNLPIAIDGVYGFRGSVIRWMLSPCQADRPTAAKVLESFAEAEKNNLLTAGLPGIISVSDVHVCTEEISTEYPSFIRFAYDQQGNRYIARILHWMWSGGTGLNNDLFKRQKAYMDRTELRLNEISKRSRTWNKENPGIDICYWRNASPYPICWSALSGDVCIPLKRLREFETSVFVLDARMTDILYIAQVLHDDDYIMGILSEKSFYVSINSVGSRVHYSDAFSSLSLFSVPRAGDLALDCDEVRIMSPEMCAFISTQNETETEAYQLNLSPASDVFALGMLYHLILTGRYPQVNTISQFDETKPYATYSNAICHALHPEQAIVLDHSLDRKHSELIRRMIALDPLDRISDCGQIANIIMSFYTE